MFKRIILSIAIFSLSGCLAQEKYYDSVAQQNLTMQLMETKKEKKAEIRRYDHQEKMATILTSAMSAAAESTDKTDDVLVPIVFMTLEDKWQTSEMLADSRTTPMQLQKIEAPEKISDIVKATGNVLLGGGMIYLGVKQSEGLVDVAKAGIEGAGTHVTGDKNVVDSNKSGTDNSISGTGNSVTGGDTASKTEVSEAAAEVVSEEDIASCGEIPSQCPDAVCVGDTWKVDSSNTEYGKLSCDTYIKTYL